MAMVVCPSCQKETDADLPVCVHCGRSLGTDPSITTISPQVPVGDAVLSGWGTDTFAGKRYVIIHVKDGPQPIIIEPRDEVIIGRVDRISGEAPVVDLGPYDGAEKGVSRKHAILRRDADQLVIVDLDSTNGTFLNEAQLVPGVPYPLHDGDAVRLGRLMLHIYFK